MAEPLGNTASTSAAATSGDNPPIGRILDLDCFVPLRRIARRRSGVPLADRRLLTEVVCGHN
jgi:hypothetical protein